MRRLLLDNVIFVSFVVICLAIILAIILLRYSYRVSQEKSPKSLIATFGAQFLITILIGLWLNNLFSSARENDQRLWTLRQEHLVRLRPVLRTDSEKLSYVARRIYNEGRVSDINNDAASNEAELDALFYPDVLTRDLASHYKEYWREKQHLRSDVEEQDAEFRETVVLVTKTLTLPRIAEHRRIEVARSVLEKCLGKGPGITITISPSGYSFAMLGGSGSSGGSSLPPSDLLAAARAFKAFRPDPEATAHCESLDRRAATIYENANKLSAQALLLAERTTLSGECVYVKLD